MENLHLTKEAASSETADWGAFWGAWLDTYGDTPRLIGNPFVGNGSDKGRGEFDGDKSLLHLIDEHGLAIPVKGETPEQRVTSLGLLLRYRKGRVFKDQGRAIRLTSDGRGTDNKQLWCVSLVVISAFTRAAEDILLGYREDE